MRAQINQAHTFLSPSFSDFGCGVINKPRNVLPNSTPSTSHHALSRNISGDLMNLDSSQHHVMPGIVSWRAVYPATINLSIMRAQINQAHTFLSWTVVAG
jgi:hypothetical protein